MIEYEFVDEPIRCASGISDALSNLQHSMLYNLFSLEELLMNAKTGSIELDDEDMCYCLFQAFDRYKAELALACFIGSEYERLREEE